MQNSRSFHARSRRGFTLVELLTVVAVILVLASLLAPALGALRNRGRAIACLSNLRQVGIASTLYLSDHEGAFPVGIDVTTENDGNPRAWTAMLAQYAGGHPEIYRCAAESAPKDADST